MLANQYKLLALTAKSDRDTYATNAEILLRGYTGMYHHIFDSVSEPQPESVTNEVHDVLSMFFAIDNAIDELSEEQKSQLDLDRLSFGGFDGNNDNHFGQAKFMVEKLDLYEERKGRKLDSHTSSSLPKYKKMLAIYKQDVEGSGRGVTFEVLQKLQAV